MVEGGGVPLAEGPRKVLSSETIQLSFAGPEVVGDRVGDPHFCR